MSYVVYEWRGGSMYRYGSDRMQLNFEGRTYRYRGQTLLIPSAVNVNLYIRESEASVFSK